jgi:FkbM family methyltransferase
LSGGKAGSIQHLKRLVAAVLCSPWMGRRLRRVLGGEVRSRGCMLDLSDPVVEPSKFAAIFWGLYERWERRFATQWLPTDVPVVELGSSLGVVSAAICHRLAPGVKLVCLEANTRLLGVLRRNLDLNGRSDAALVHAAIDYENLGLNTVPFVGTGDTLVACVARDGAGEEISRTTLRAVLATHGIGDFSLVSDIEGAEAGLIAEERDTLQRCRCAVLELHNTTYRGRELAVPQLVAALEEMGLRLVAEHFPVYAFRRE